MVESLEQTPAGEAGMEALADRLARALRPELAGNGALVVLFEGDLGAGKTTLVRGILRGLGHEGRVPSPTYTLIEPYRLPTGERVQHLDLYRLGDAEELEYLGWRDWLGARGLLLVEWPERAADLMQHAHLKVVIEFHGEARRVHLQALAPTGRRVLAGLQAAPE